MMFEIRDDTGRVWRMSGRDHEHAARRVADLHRVTVVAWRQSRDPRDAIGVLGRAEQIDG